MDREEKLELLGMLDEQVRRVRMNRLRDYRPYSKQLQFHAVGATIRERLLMAANQVGKTYCAGAEIAMHATGRYPEWWGGKCFAHPVTVWVASETMEVSRDAAQRILLGRAHERGTGAIPGDDITMIAPYPNVKDAATMCRVRHVSGGESIVIFKSYDQGRTKFQGDSIHVIWFDEEPTAEIYSEGLTRTNATHGIALMTFTPLLGMSEVVRRFIAEESPDRVTVRMGIADAEHYTPEQRERIIASYPEHERKARAEGIPMLGEGAVFPIARSKVEYESFPIPKHWPRICGLDFGWDHPTAAGWLAWDRDTDVVYVYDCYAVSRETPVVHAAAVKARGAWIPCAWPHDGLQHDKGSGEQLAQQYRTQGVAMLADRATFADGTNGLEAGVMDMLERMQTGRLKFASHLNPLWDEFSTYHRDNGRIVKEHDDILSAIRYGIMMLRKAAVEQTEPLSMEFEVDY